MNTDYLLAYVGPGPGLTMFWAFVALIATIGLAILTLLLWPLRMLLTKLRRARTGLTDNAADAQVTAADANSAGSATK